MIRHRALYEPLSRENQELAQVAWGLRHERCDEADLVRWKSEELEESSPLLFPKGPSSHPKNSPSHEAGRRP